MHARLDLVESAIESALTTFAIGMKSLWFDGKQDAYAVAYHAQLDLEDTLKSLIPCREGRAYMKVYKSLENAWNYAKNSKTDEVARSRAWLFYKLALKHANNV